MNIAITKSSYYAPDRVVDNHEIVARYPGVGTVEDAYGKTGILERRYSDDLTTSGMAARAVQKILDQGVSADEIDYLIVGTLTPDYFFPSTAVVVINELKLKNAAGYDVNNACPSFLFGIEQGVSLIKAGKAKKVVVCGADRMSKTLNSFDHKTGVLFGDGAGCVLLEESSDANRGIQDTLCRVVTDNLEDVYFRTPFSVVTWENSEKFEIDGKKVYNHGVQFTVELINDYFKEKGLSAESFDYVVPHQSNMRMIRKIAEGTEIPIEKFIVNIENHGNTAGASVPLCFAQMRESGVLKDGNRVLLVSFGAGYTLSLADVII